MCFVFDSISAVFDGEVTTELKYFSNGTAPPLGTRAPPVDLFWRRLCYPLSPLRDSGLDPITYNPSKPSVCSVTVVRPLLLSYNVLLISMRAVQPAWPVG
jgi:hypothetical protein